MKTPRLLTDLYGDLRDRRLLPVVLVLIAATAAVPFLLRADEQTMPAAPPDPAAETAEMPMLPAVLASNPSLRDYRERLDSLSAKNPFAGEADAEVPGPESIDEALAETAESAGVDVAGSGGGVSASTTSADSSSAATSETGDTDSAATATPVDTEPSGGGGNTEPSGGGGNTEPTVLAFRVDVEVGPAGATERRRDVKLMTPLPSESNPVLLFLGASEDGKRAGFLVSDDVVTVRGGGKCVPAPSACQLLYLKPGDEMKLGYAPTGEPDTFVIRLNDIRLERNHETAEEEGREEREDEAGALEGVRAFFGR